MITVLLADDHIVMRQGLRALIDSQADLQVVGEASNGHEALEMIQQKKPAVSVLDLMMPGLSGLEVTRQVWRISPVLILSMHADEAYVIEALRKGASGYVLKDATANELIQAIRIVASGQRYLSSPFSERAISAYIQRVKTGSLEPYDTLTTREREILQLVAEGRNSAEIAQRLSISPRTVEAHRASLNRKLDIHSQADLIRLAMKKGLLPLDK
ncbi:MAG TPA: DNA-binding response regulator [Anaerolineaceae bacterium]|nr:MAG: DNA-binding response regulator [Chloroflexi bacterium GWB2_54_36]HAL17330.1 DNA-binding response regulator [Anaerolineaceae bacterium]HBA92557.1 DNA-binding response regulator [Anaerolineaceae bacterium]